MEPTTVVFAFLDFGHGGAQRAALETAVRMDRRAFRPIVLCVRGVGTPALRREAVARGIRVIRLGRMGRAWDVGAVVDIARVLRRYGTGVLLVPHYSRVMPYAMLAGALARIPVRVVHHHGHRPKSGALRRWADQPAGSGARHVVHTKVEHERLLLDGHPPDCVAMVRRGVDLERFAPRADGRDGAPADRESLGLPVDAPLILVPARLAPVKGHTDVLAALASAPLAETDARLVFLGDGPLRGKLEALVASAGLKDRVHFVGHREDVARWMVAVDVVCLASRDEGRSAVVMEAMACGCPVVATRVGGVPELIADGRTGRLVPPRKPDMLASVLAELLGDRAQRERLAAAAKAHARCHFDVQTGVRELEAQLVAWLEEAGTTVDGSVLRSRRPTGRGEDDAAREVRADAVDDGLNRPSSGGPDHWAAAPGRSISAAAGRERPANAGTAEKPAGGGPTCGPEADRSATGVAGGGLWGADEGVAPWCRVLHVRSTAGRHGPERGILELIPALEAQGVISHVLATHRGGPEATRWLEEVRAAGCHARAWAVRDPSSWSPAGMRAVREHATDCDVVHTHDYRADFFAWAAGTGRPWVATVHLQTGATPALRLWEALDRRVLRSADRVLTVSGVQASALRRLGLAALTTPTVIDAEAFAGRAGGRERFRAARGLAETDRVVVAVGRLTEQKGFDVLIRAFPAIQRRCPRARLLIAGDGPQRTPLERLVGHMGLGSAVGFLGTIEDVPTLLAAADVVAMPSREEGLPMALMEAMAVGVPVVATPVGGIPEASDGGRAIRLVPVGDVAALGEAIASLLDRPEAARALGARGYAWVRRHRAPEVEARRIAAVYRAVMAAS